MFQIEKIDDDTGMGMGTDTLEVNSIEPSMEDTKTIHFLPTNHVQKGTNRIITMSKKWNFTKEQLDNQMQLINDLQNIVPPLSPIQLFVIDQIKQKINSYKYQDIRKNILCREKFILTPSRVIKLLYDCKLLCYYCNNETKVIYERVCEPTQWTLERQLNHLGHNIDNVVISCLKCNLGRRTMHENRFLFTKRTVNIIKQSGI